MQALTPVRARHPRLAAAAATAAFASGTAIHAATGFLALPGTAPARGAVNKAVGSAGAGSPSPARAVGSAAAQHMGSLELAAPAVRGLACLGAVSLAFARSRRGSTARPASSFGSEGSTGSPEDAIPFEIRGVSLAQLALLLGFGLIVYSFLDYFLGSGATSGLSSLTFIYSIPVLVLGAALQYAELKPVEVVVKPGAEGLFEAKQTTTLTKIKADVTRHRYGDDAHLDSSLECLGLTLKQGKYPQLKQCIEEKTDEGELQFTMLFESRDVPWTMWSDPQKTIAMDRFFGPGVWSKVYKHDGPNKIAGLILTTGTRPAAEEAEKKKKEEEAESVPTK